MSSIRLSLRDRIRWSSEREEERDAQRDNRERVLLGIAGLFLWTNAIAYSLVRGTTPDWLSFGPVVLWSIVAPCAHLSLSNFKPKRDPYLLPIFAFLSGWGLLLQARLAPNFLGRQTLWFFFGIALVLVVAILPRSLRPLQKYRYLLLTGGLLLLGITLAFGVNPSGSGAALWLPIPFPFRGSIYFQPSELLKLLFIIFLASYFTEQEPLYVYHKRTAGQRRRGSVALSFRHQLPFLGPLLLMWGFTILLLIWQQDLGAAVLFFLVFIALLYLATGSLLYVSIGLLLLALAAMGLFFIFDTVATNRILSWINPWPDSSTIGYQIVQSLYAQAAGGVLGAGIGQGFPDYIPVVHSDFVLAAIAEEWGVLGSLAIVASFSLLAQRGLRIAIMAVQGRQPNHFHAYIAAGITVMFGIQAILIMGGVTKLLPLTGITVPFVSYGGSSLVVSSAMIGLLLFLSAAGSNRSAPDDIKLQSPSEEQFARRIIGLARVLLLAMMIVAAALVYWSVIRSDVLLARQDNPRLVEAERRIQRGRILDRRGQVLAESTELGGILTRIYPVPESGHAVGYYSIRYGSAGIEQALDTALRGVDKSYWAQAVRQFMHLPLIGNDIHSTLDGELQTFASTQMSGRTGALVLLEITDDNHANVLAMVSQPGFDPNELESQFDVLSAGDPGSLFNRATQGLYQPGLILQPLILAGSIDDGLLSLSDSVSDPHLPVTLNGFIQRCHTRLDENTDQGYSWSEMIQMGCPAPLYALGETLGPDRLRTILERFGLNQAPEFVLPVSADAGTNPIDNPSMAAIGQEALTVSPLQIALAYSILANDGRRPSPQLVESITDINGARLPDVTDSETADSKVVLSAAAAAAIREALPASDSISGTTISVLSGPDGSRNTWFAGMNNSGPARYVVAIVLEDEADPVVVEAIGRSVLSAALAQPNTSE